MEQLFNAIPAFLKNLGPNPEADKAIVFAAWKRCSGESLSSRTAPLDFFEHRLVIAVADKTWQRNLEELSPQMLVKLNDHLGQGTVRFIEFRIDPSAQKTI
jgi:predicted nucleic acid-binding Zn ribbon protein